MPYTTYLSPKIKPHSKVRTKKKDLLGDLSEIKAVLDVESELIGTLVRMARKRSLHPTST